MKWLIYISVFVFAVGCNKPKTISDADLQQILQEVFLVNAYCSNNAVNCDSIDIYEPILDKYNYTAADMAYTINSYSKRKSSKLTDVINEAILGLEREYQIYKDKVAILDTIDLIVEKRYRTIIYDDSLLVVNSFADTSKLRIKLPAKDGKYNISYNYQFDSTDVNYGIRANYKITDSTNKTVANNTNWLKSYAREKVSVTLNSSPKSKELVLHLASYNKSSSKPNLTIDSLVIVYYLPKAVAMDSVNKSLLNYKLLIDGKEYNKATQDSSSLHTHPPRSIATGSSEH